MLGRKGVCALNFEFYLLGFGRGSKMGRDYSKREPGKQSAHEATAGQEEAEPVVMTSQPDQNESQVRDEIMNFSGLRTTYLLCACLSLVSDYCCV